MGANPPGLRAVAILSFDPNESKKFPVSCTHPGRSMVIDSPLRLTGANPCRS